MANDALTATCTPDNETPKKGQPFNIPIVVTNPTNATPNQVAVIKKITVHPSNPAAAFSVSPPQTFDALLNDTDTFSASFTAVCDSVQTQLFTATVEYEQNGIMLGIKSSCEATVTVT
jgi:hypothetical protein